MTDDHSPQLDGPLRRRERAALDLAVMELVMARFIFLKRGPHHVAALIQSTLDRIETLVPGSTK